MLDAPDRLNALNPDDIAELDAAYAAAEEAGVRALVLRGEGRAFCAGRDISGVDPRTDDVHGYLGGLVTPLLRRMSAFPAPTFAVAHGACLGVGLGLLIATDVVYVADTAKIGSPFANLGATLDSGGHALFFERLGAHKTLDLIYTARLMSGTEAVESGLFSRVFPADDVLEATRDAARGGRDRCDPGVPGIQVAGRSRCATSASGCGTRSTSRTAPRRPSATPTTTARASRPSRRSARRRSRGGAEPPPSVPVRPDSGWLNTLARRKHAR